MIHRFAVSVSDYNRGFSVKPRKGHVVNLSFILLILRDEIVVKKEDLKTTHKGLTVCKYKESNLGPIAGFSALIIIIAKRLVRDVELE